MTKKTDSVVVLGGAGMEGQETTRHLLDKGSFSKIIVADTCQII